MARQRGPEVADKRYLSETTLALLQTRLPRKRPIRCHPRRYHGIVKPTEPQAKHQLDLHHSQGRDPRNGRAHDPKWDPFTRR
jgi:hypothetical protein